MILNKTFKEGGQKKTGVCACRIKRVPPKNYEQIIFGVKILTWGVPVRLFWGLS